MENYTLVGWQILYPRKNVKDFIRVIYAPTIIYKTLEEAINKFSNEADKIGLKCYGLMTREHLCGEFFGKDWETRPLIEYYEKRARELNVGPVQITGSVEYKDEIDYKYYENYRKIGCMIYANHALAIPVYIIGNSEDHN